MMKAMIASSFRDSQHTDAGSENSGWAFSFQSALVALLGALA